MEDGHTLFDYNVGLNDIVQLLVRQALPSAAAALPKDKEAELSDSDSGCGSAQSESDKGSTHGESDGQIAGTSVQTDAPDLVDPGFGFYKVRWAGKLAFNKSKTFLRKLLHPIIKSNFIIVDSTTNVSLAVFFLLFRS